MSDNALDAVLNRLGKLHPVQIDLSLKRITTLLDGLGNPQDALPPVIHVAGTNGKGSTIAFLKAFLEAAGKTVHTYTSPHLVRFNERICVRGREISDSDLTALLCEVESVNAGAPITFFESTTAAAFLAFSRTPADFVLLETGLGGRLDATNVVKNPAAVVITSLSMDHESYLGDTLAKIAAEKAAIIKEKRPVFAAFSKKEALDVLVEQAALKQAALSIEGRDFFVSCDERTFEFNGTVFTAPALCGGHQQKNASLALAVMQGLEKQGLVETTYETLCAGLKNVRWQARLQKVGSLCRKDFEVWLDGGHNPGAGAVLADFLPIWRDRPLYLICGMISSKDSSGYLNQILPFAKGFIAVPVDNGTAPTQPPEFLMRLAKQKGVETALTASTVKEALFFLKTRVSSPVRILICGSLYLAGSVLKQAEN